MMWIGIILLLTAFAKTRAEAVCASDLRTYNDAVDLLPGLRVLHAGPCYLPIHDIARLGHRVRSSNIVRKANRNGLRTNLFGTETSVPDFSNSGYNGGVPYYPSGSASYPGGSYQPGGSGSYQPGGPYQPGGSYQPPNNCALPGQPCQSNSVPYNTWTYGQQNIGAAPES